MEIALYLIPVTLGETPPEMVLPAGLFNIMNQLDEFIVENARSARRFLKSAGYQRNFDEVTFNLLNKHTARETADTFIDSIKNGKAVGLLSEAGVPCIADPGAEIVKHCHLNNIRVIPLTGPSSIILALMGSGFNGQNFTFHGYLPIEKSQLKTKLKEIESDILKKDQTQIFIETPYRNNQMIDFLISFCHSKTKLCIASELTTENEFIVSRHLLEWKKIKYDFHKKPVVFLLYK
ncbi:MAG: SAM-dependent methyltransferase [Bacteroidales bacterium]|nr:SAM-dependent methyltransferase [Bacteroidales bacterium]